MPLLRLFPGLLIAFAVIAPAFANPVKLATSARVDLFAETSVGSIEGGFITTGGGSLERMGWIAPADQPRSYSCSLPTVHFGWSEHVIQFTPGNSGTVEVKLMGVWEASSDGGLLYRQEVYWDHLAATGATLLNGSFEDGAGPVPSAWARPFGDAVVLSAPVPAQDGTRCVRTWHDGPLTQNIAVTGGQKVTLRLFSRAVLPAGTSEMPRITNPNSAAHQARLKYLRGTNLGNYLEAPAGQDWGQTYDATDFATIKAQGFDHVRIPVRWHDRAGPAPDYLIDESFALQVDALLDAAAANGLAAIVNIHHYEPFMSDPAGETAKFYALWEQIATRYAARPDTVAFELLNEPHGAATSEVLNPIYAEVISRIRVTNPNRPLFVGPGSFNAISELPALSLPGDDDKLIVTVHSYAPFLFTHQGAGWTGDSTATTGIVFPGPPETPLTPAPAAAGESWVVEWISEYNTQPRETNPCSARAFLPDLDLAKLWSDYYGRPIHVGEFGAYEPADAGSRARFYGAMREAMDARGFGWAMWDWKAGFFYWDDELDQPAPGLQKSLFPAGALRMPGPGELEMDSAVGKSFRIWRTQDFSTWTALADTSLGNPVLTYEDPSPPPGRAYYRADWLMSR